jgi:hypothetical protein
MRAGAASTFTCCGYDVGLKDARVVIRTRAQSFDERGPLGTHERG